MKLIRMFVARVLPILVMLLLLAAGVHNYWWNTKTTKSAQPQPANAFDTAWHLELGEPGAKITTYLNHSTLVVSTSQYEWIIDSASGLLLDRIASGRHVIKAPVASSVDTVPTTSWAIIPLNTESQLAAEFIHFGNKSEPWILSCYVVDTRNGTTFGPVSDGFPLSSILTTGTHLYACTTAGSVFAVEL